MSGAGLLSCSKSTESKIEKKFTNADIQYKTELKTIYKIAKAYFKDNREAVVPNGELPIKLLTKSILLQETSDAVFRLGHSTMLIRLNGEYILLDPVFSERASPVQWAGPKRFHPTPIEIAELPPIKAVIISHDHYDHLDEAAIKLLAGKTEKFITPLNVGNYLVKWGVDKTNIIELNWWQSTNLDGLSLTATPAQHFSGRGLFDRDETLWASWVIQSDNTKLFFSGDSGYFDGFKEIGERYGPFDITMIETGAYNELWSEIHMLPEQSLQAHLDLKGKAMLPIHNGTFDLSLHNWYEPLEKISALAASHQVKLLTPIFGEEVAIKDPTPSLAWWREFILDSENLLALN